MKSTASKHSAQTASRRDSGFTLVELLAMVVLLGILGTTLLTGMARSGSGSRSYQCLNNNRRLCAAWRMYADDNHDVMVFASEDGTQNPLNRYAWMGEPMDYNPNNRSNWDPYEIMKRPLWPYSGSNASIYRCPSDSSRVIVNGVPKPRTRTMSMNLYLGGFAGTDGGWPFASNYRIFLKTTDLTAPGPAKTFVFIEQRWDKVIWAGFLTDMSGYPASPALYKLEDFPNMIHDSACSFSFADGHGEMHRWQDPRTTPSGISAITSGAVACPNNPDVAWLQDHSTRPKP